MVVKIIVWLSDTFCNCTKTVLTNCPVMSAVVLSGQTEQVTDTTSDVAHSSVSRAVP